jgi:NitT/TauT family transport system substrate-binding protein
MQCMPSRRRVLATLSSAAAACLGGAKALAQEAPPETATIRNSFAEEAPPETTTIRLIKNAGICVAPQYVADELLRAEGFTEIQYVMRSPAIMAEAISRGEVDLSLHFAALLLPAIDASEAITVLAGVHVGCFELFAKEPIRGIRDLKDKKVGIQGAGGQQHAFVAAMAAHVGLNPVKDIDWVISPTPPPMELFVEGKIDAFLGFPPESQELRARKVGGHVVVNSSTDRPWSQYFCCMLAGNRDFVRKHPMATKRVMRAILKATDFCVANPTTAAQRMVDRGFTAHYDYALQMLREVPYNKWREYDPEDTLRFYARRLREAGMIKSAPNKLIADATDWRFLNELKRELKG